MAMDWFEKLMGFAESTGAEGYEKTRQRLQVEGKQLRSRVNGRSFCVGELELVSLATLRERAGPAPQPGRRNSVNIVIGDVRQLHALAAYEGALFQVASQFNLLEMLGPSVTPEDGVTIYAGDPTQGPACAIAAGAATVYRNYFAPVGDDVGQTALHQLDGFADLGAAIARELGRPSETLWSMRNGYAMFERNGLALMSAHVAALDETQRDALRGRLRIGMQWDVEVTDSSTLTGPLVSQAFCSALPVSYNDRRIDSSSADWAPLASLVLEAAYEATLWAAVINAQRGASRTVLLTMLGGGAFGNEPAWILAAMDRAVERGKGHGLDIVLVSFGRPSEPLQQWAARQN